MNPRDLDEARLGRLVGATRARANPAVLARARARIEARASVPGVALWLARPAVLAGAGALFVLCIAGAFLASERASATTGSTTLVTALLGEEDLGLPVAANAATVPSGAAGDSGGVNP